MKKINNYKVLEDNNDFKEFFLLYEDLFVPEERASRELLLERIRLKETDLHVVKLNNEVVGFYILKNIVKLKFKLFTYLGVKREYQGQGLGSKIVNMMTERLNCEKNNYLFLEAHKRQALWYQSLGFKKVSINYFAPSYGEGGEITMNLMVYTKEKSIQCNYMKEVLFYTYSHIYKVENNKTQELINSITDEVSIISI